MHVVGGSGAGKTPLLQNLILHDLQSDDPPALVIVDSQGDLINKLSRLALSSIRRWLRSPIGVCCSSRRGTSSIRRPSISSTSTAIGLANTTKRQRSRSSPASIQTFDYLFCGPPRRRPHRQAGRVLPLRGAPHAGAPGDDGTERDHPRHAQSHGRAATTYRKAIERLPPIQRKFFERDFLDPKKHLQPRPRNRSATASMPFSRTRPSPGSSRRRETRIDLFDTSTTAPSSSSTRPRTFLKGRIGAFRAHLHLAGAAGHPRARGHPGGRTPADIPHRRRGGRLFRQQYRRLPDRGPQVQMRLRLRPPVPGPGTHGRCGPRSPPTPRSRWPPASRRATRARWRPIMRTTADFILSQPRLHFAAHLRDITPNAVSIPVAAGRLEAEPRMDEHSYDHLRELNRDRVSIPEPMRGESFTVKDAEDGSKDDSARPTRTNSECHPSRRPMSLRSLVIPLLHPKIGEGRRQGVGGGLDKEMDWILLRSRGVLSLARPHK